MNDATDENEDDLDDDGNDPPLTPAQQVAADRLTDADLRVIDAALLKHLTGLYRKVA
ncbi:hypothetical protein [Paraburkholderia dipogonis]|uniref:hypothetical protein n=1 Tax=Paraburkholderia dipogonis TaxID=1211383 RepID=UPI0038BD0AF3